MKTTGLSKWALSLALLIALHPASSRAQTQYVGTSDSGYASSALGLDSTAAGMYSFAAGQGTYAPGEWATAFGQTTTAEGSVSMAWGATALAYGGASTAFGYYTTAEGGESTAFGQFATATGYGSTAFGFASSAVGDWSTAFGYEANAYGLASVAMNLGAAYGTYSTALGWATQASGTASVASGFDTWAPANFSTAFGYQTQSDALDSLVIGAYNWGGGDPINWVGTDPLFEVGNGTLSGQSDALVVYKNGNTTITGSDNELPHQALIGGNSILTESLGDGRYLRTSGNIGIGATSPSTLLQVGDGGGGKAAVDSTDNYYGQFQVANPTSNGEASIGFISGATGFGDSPASTNGTGNIWAMGAGIWGIGGSTFGIGNDAYGGSVLNLTSTGNVGIGTATPGAPLEIAAGTGGNLRIGDPGYGGLVVGSNANGNETDFVGGIPSGNPTTGNSMGGQIRLGGSARGDTMINGIQFLQNGTEVMRIANGGNVGIGATAPAATLDVNGTARFSGTAKVNGGLVVTGSAVTVGSATTIVANASNLVLIPQQSDLSMGSFTAGAQPPTTP